ncbi:MAG: ParB/RepB/Spo0J family partition protein [Candidatus Brocadiales bacterium]|nr:ParB/RepB/Spo0J family partition protein [Candidatus Bathyanammoxibius sp.]
MPEVKEIMLDRGKLGRSLDSLLGNIAEVEPTDSILQISPESIQPNPHQPRREFSPQAIGSLVESIREHGMLQPILVRPAKDGYQLLAGERRWRAAKELGLGSIPAIVKEATSKQSLGIALVENLQREDLNPIERAKAFWELMEVFGLTQEQVGKYVGMDRSSVANTLRLLELSIEIQEHVSRGTISQGHARALLAAKGESLQQRLCQRVIDEGLTVRQTEALAASVSKNTRRKRQNGRNGNNHNAREHEDRLSMALGTKVQIRYSGSKGKVVIHFNGNPQFEDLMSRLCGG